MSFVEFCCAVRSLSRIHGFSVVSWGRTQKRNKNVGGLPDSWHLEFMAVDVVLDDPARSEALRADGRALLLDVVFEEDCIHLEPTGPRTSLPAG